MGLPEGGTCNVRSQHTKDTPDSGPSAPNNLGTPSGGPLGNLGNGCVCPLSATVTLPMSGTSAVSGQAVPSGGYRNLGVASGLSDLSNGSALSGRYVRL
jgi:hypothetical protein